MTFEEYQKKAITFDAFENQGPIDSIAFFAKLLGLCGESGEVADKFKKIYRNNKGVMTPENKLEIKKELGDVLWYLSVISSYLDIPLEEVVATNLAKLTDRKSRDVISSTGDNR